MEFSLSTITIVDDPWMAFEGHSSIAFFKSVYLENYTGKLD